MTRFCFIGKIAIFGKEHLQPKGKLFFEINEAHGNEVMHLLTSLNYREVEIKKDLQQKDRMIKSNAQLIILHFLQPLRRHVLRPASL